MEPDVVCPLLELPFKVCNNSTAFFSIEIPAGASNHSKYAVGRELQYSNITQMMHIYIYYPRT